MSSSPDPAPLVSLVLKSKKALQTGEKLCFEANAQTNKSAQAAFDILALDAKVKWISEAVLEQLELAANVAKHIEQKRASLAKRAQEWDTTRTSRSDSLDAVLESLGSQLVPPDFHQSSSDSSLFGSQHSDDEEEQVSQSPSNTIRESKHEDRKKWKTLRDFVDERAIEDALDVMDSDRAALEDTLATTDRYPETLSTTITRIKTGLPGGPALSLASLSGILTEQDEISTSMAHHLESLAAHYGQMSNTLHDVEGGEEFTDEDISDMNRDTEELPSILGELEENAAAIESTHAQLVKAEQSSQEQLDTHTPTVDQLDELAEIMEEMLLTQAGVETTCVRQITSLQEHLCTMDELKLQFTAYQLAFNKLLLEIGRRRQYREAAENIVRGMMAQLHEMTEEEHTLRASFNEEHGPHLPEDLCLCVENPPTRWEVLPRAANASPASGWNREALEVLPEIDVDLLKDAQRRIGIIHKVEGSGGSQSI